MRILFVSQELIAVELCTVLQLEGHDLKLYIGERELRDCYDGMAEKILDWKQELDWVGKDGLIIFDDVGFGTEQDRLRNEGYRVVGGSALGDKLEIDRNYGQEVFDGCGMENILSYNFPSPEDAIEFVKAHPKVRWVVKQNGGHVSSLNYVGTLENNEDVIGVLSHYNGIGIRGIHLQQKVSGIEMGVGRYFNGNDWVGPIEMNIEHKSLMPHGIGPKTPEMGTLMWYDKDEENKLFRATLGKMRSYLKEIAFHGDIDINCIVSGDSIWPLEATARFGTPSTSCHMEIHNSPWGEFLSAIADGVVYDLDYKPGYAMVVTVAVPPFPFTGLPQEFASEGMAIHFREKPVKDEMSHYYFEEVLYGKKHIDGMIRQQYFVAGHKGCVGYVGGAGATIEEARTQAYGRMDNLVVPKMFYRDDIGLEFLEKDERQLKEWGWL
ncbi:MAG: hypothetical protein KBD19_02445 [Candidatus Moranbacteria bacterium]|nr:hypothetical protein [Candidatus Moranbacteria bacterium]